jgi:hypothetical protein
MATRSSPAATDGKSRVAGVEDLVDLVELELAELGAEASSSSVRRPGPVSVAGTLTR